MIYPTLEIEQSLWQNGYNLIAGIDEVGRGCFAGPVVVGAVIFPKGCELLKGVADSKLLKPLIRETLSEEIKKFAASWAIAEIDVPVINKVGIGKATQIAFFNVVKLLKQAPDFILIDAFAIANISPEIQKPIVNGDKICASISAASIIAKVYRDQLMTKLHNQFPEYGFAQHKGYGTKQHREAIKIHGLSKLHRTSFNLEKFL
jgi:ribonuclease HII